MKRFLLPLILLTAIVMRAQVPSPSNLDADARYKADLLLVVAHPDDEGAVTPFIARILDEGKRVAVVYGTRGASGSNQNGSEHAAALGDVREIEARTAWTSLGVSNVWFLDGNDTATQNVLDSLAHWGHGQALEKMVRIVRLTRPDVVLTFFPGVFIGENHGDHQAAGVIATEAFDLAADPSVFPSQVAAATQRLEPYLENLQPWQSRKLYYFNYGDHDPEYANSGPTYSVRGVSKSKNIPYWRMAVEAFEAHLTQEKAYIDSLRAMDKAQFEKMAAGDDGWASDQHFVLGKSLAGGNATDDMFANVGSLLADRESRSAQQEFVIALGGPWKFYDNFRRAHGLDRMPQIAVPEIAVAAGKTLEVPIELRNSSKIDEKVSLAVNLPMGWVLQPGPTVYTVASGETIAANLQVDLPTTPSASASTNPTQEVSVVVTSDGHELGSLRLRVELRKRALPQ